MTIYIIFSIFMNYLYILSFFIYMAVNTCFVILLEIFFRKCYIYNGDNKNVWSR